MEVRKRRLTLGRLMAAIGIVALGFAMSRVDAAPAVSACVFAGCTWYLAGRRYAEAVAGIGPEEGPIRPSRQLRIAARCLAGAAMAIGLPDAAFLAGYYGYMEVVRATYRTMKVPVSIFGATDTRPDLEPQHILFGALIGGVAALYVAAIMRRGVRPRPAARRSIPSPAARAAAGPGADGGRVSAEWVGDARPSGP